ncbi:ABC transporter permease [Streptosporangium sp. H16]|uniref:ABC transporter permease n=1 Tax=Streptosporangium sp. H16 TaxID=3444184 RepID=UPI003F7B133D
MITTMVRHETASFFRSPVAAIFTLAMPLMMMVIIGAAVGDTPGVMQVVVPALAVFGVAQACFGSLAMHLADLRERGYLKRMRGTPVPAWAVMASLIGAALVIALVALALIMGVGVAFYGVRPVWHTLPALLVTVLVGAACFTALGIALVSLVRNAAAVQMLGSGLLLALAFISDIILHGARMPAWLDTVGWIFPLRHLANAVTTDLDPLTGGAGFEGGHLAVLAAWGIGGAAVAVWLFSWERPQERSRAATAARRRPLGARTAWRLVGGQAAHAIVKLRRNLSTAFFTVALPVLLLVLISLVFGGASVDGLGLPAFMLAAMTTYTIGVTGYVNQAEAVAADKEGGVLKRLAGTPLPPWAYHAGRATAGLGTTLVTVIVLGVLSVLVYDVRITAGMLPGAMLAVVLGLACFTLLGTLVAGLAVKATTANAITLGTFLPLAFVSDVFVIGGTLPRPLGTIGDLFPLKHLSHALRALLDPAGPVWPWADLAVVAGWTMAAAAAVTVMRARTWTSSK